MASPYTFISYARADGDFVLRLAKELRARGVSLWVDQLDIKVGQVWDTAVEEALEGCETFLIVLSPTAIASKNVMDELSFALEEDKRIVPLLHQDCKVPFRVRRLQRADFTVNYDTGMKLLLEVLDVAEMTIDPPAPEKPTQPKTEPEKADPVPSPKVKQLIDTSFRQNIVTEAPLPSPVVEKPPQPKPEQKNLVQKAKVLPPHESFAEILSGSVELDMVAIPGRSFWMGKYQVTQEQWKAVMGDNQSFFMDNYCPVEQVSWEDAQKFCKKLSAKTSKKYRLPTEDEWEYACRAGSKGGYYFGDDVRSLEDYAWYAENSGSKTHPVGKKKPNAWGLYDMHGNVWEWCEDLYKEGSESRVVRGGSSSDVAWLCRSDYRGSNSPDDRGIYQGFRVVCGSART